VVERLIHVAKFDVMGKRVSLWHNRPSPQEY
jgi:hypothetical protein